MKKQSALGLHCLSRPFFWQASRVCNFRTFIAAVVIGLCMISLVLHLMASEYPGVNHWDMPNGD